MAPVVAAYYQLGLEYVLQFAESAIRVTQNTDEAVAMGLAFARILYSLVTGAASTPSVAVTQCIDALKDPARAQPTKLDEHLARKLEDVQPKQGEAPVVDFIAAGQALGLKIN
jgi:ADP-ribosylglycohydrolase